MRSQWPIAIRAGGGLAARAVLCIAAMLVLPGGAQGPPQPHGLASGQRLGRSPADQDGDNFRETERLVALNRQRQKNMVSDTDKLLKLATELETEVEGGGEEHFTPEQLHKISEIEKLARSVKDKMTYSVKGPVFQEPLPFSIH